MRMMMTMVILCPVVVGNWREELLAVVDKEEMPTYWGGTGEERDDIAYHVSTNVDPSGQSSPAL